MPEPAKTPEPPKWPVVITRHRAFLSAGEVARREAILNDLDRSRAVLRDVAAGLDGANLARGDRAARSGAEYRAAVRKYVRVHRADRRRAERLRTGRATARRPKLLYALVAVQLAALVLVSAGHARSLRRLEALEARAAARQSESERWHRAERNVDQDTIASLRERLRRYEAKFPNPATDDSPAGSGRDYLTASDYGFLELVRGERRLGITSGTLTSEVPVEEGEAE